ncbi:hypothetical protein [Colwellia psychrerythraea]|uniref:DUF1059 domain-containing protein n=1 Tax=Colwellia psychrerythraea TaxID=28229 RepID=A0A099KMP0_COLPS|nr:hypothetical protein [Colwellia psychrerythraea]KGJ90928.1 hypothetical protein GAB14E_0592 [Colwellia psychrerythraea]
MKTMNCNQLGGACDREFHGNTFEEMAEQSKQHAMDMMQKKDSAHLKAMADMSELMKDPEAMNQWFAAKRKEFEALAED